VRELDWHSQLEALAEDQVGQFGGAGEEEEKEKD
jgi:hypothetical protein